MQHFQTSIDASQKSDGQDRGRKGIGFMRADLVALGDTANPGEGTDICGAHKCGVGRGHGGGNMKSPKIEKPSICRAFCCKGSSFARTGVACISGAAAWPFGMNDVKLASFGQKLVWPMRRTGAKISALIETGRRWRQFLLAGKGPARHSLKIRYWATVPGGYH